MISYNNLPHIIVVLNYCLVLTLCHPLFFDGTSFKATMDFEPRPDNWTWIDIPRSVVPHFRPRNETHKLPPEKDEEILKRLSELKANNTGRSLWFDSYSDLVHYPPMLNKAMTMFNLKQVTYELETSIMSKVSCTACKAGVGLLQHYIRIGKSKEEIIRIISQFCTNLKIKSPRVCEGVSNMFGNEIIYVFSRVTLNPDEICSFIIGDACGDVYNPYHQWEVNFPPIPKPIPNDLPLPKLNAPTFKVLHLSDTHYDPYYAEGSNANCDEPLCCRLSNGKPATPNDAAGRWGDYRNCDSPKRTIDNMLDHITDVHPDIDYIIWTGDLPPHDIWNQTKEENLKIIKETVKQLAERFPGVPIFPALGNHESAPVNSFPPPYVNQIDSSIAWLYDALDDQWRAWLPASVSHTIKRGAFYSVLVRPGFRIISLNMNYCNNKNWWLLLNSTDPATELQWFINELQSAEFANEKVHIIGHIPPGHSDCIGVWSRNYYKIISRYESTITAQFFGHTHFDEFEVFYDTQNRSRATNVAYIGPSVTPYNDLNPGYRIYYVDGDHEHTTRLVIDHESWVMNLKEANLYDYPHWYRLYTARAAYGMVGLRPADWDELIVQMTKSNDLFDLYFKHYWKSSPVRPSCDFECKKRIICDAKSGRSHARKVFCEDIESKIDENHPKSWRAWFYRGLTISVPTTEKSAKTEALVNGDHVTPENLTEYAISTNRVSYDNVIEDNDAEEKKSENSLAEPTIETTTEEPSMGGPMLVRVLCPWC